MYRSRVLTTTLVLATAGPALGAPASPAAAASPPLATATYGNAEVAIVKRPGGQGGTQLTYTAGADRAPVVVGVKVPAKVAHIGLGLDATGLLTVVAQTPSGLSWSHVTQPKGFKPLPGTAGAESAAVYRGRVAYVCQDGRAVCRISIRTNGRRVLHREPKASAWLLDDARIGARNAIAFAAQREGALGASRIQIKRAGASPKTVAGANLDDGSEVLLRDISPDGTYLSVLRRSFVEDGEPLADPVDTLALFRFPSGRRAS